MIRRGLVGLSVLALLTTPSISNAACDRAGTDDLVVAGAHLFGADDGPRTIRISDGFICTVERDVAREETARVIDASDLIVLPGLIDSHVHLFPMGSSAGIDSDSALDRFIATELPGRLRDYVERGITTIFSVGDAWPAIADVRRRLADGEIFGPRLMITGPILTARGGYPAATICAESKWCQSRLTVQLQDAAHTRRTVHELAARGVDAIKIVYDDARAKKLDANLVRIATNEAHALGLPVIAHVTTVADALEVAELGVDVLAHLPSGGITEEPAAARLREAGTIIITTAAVYAPVTGLDGKQHTVFGLHYGPPFDKLYARGLSNARALLTQGVPLAFGSGTPMFLPSKSVEVEIAALSRIPMTRAQLIDALTINAAKALGKQAELGKIAPGMRADLIIADLTTAHDRVEPMTIIVVIKDGQIVSDRRD